jgi:chromate reductase, NAD(P)H dehydrogenase (quinone)
METSTAQPPAKTVLRVAAISGSLRRASANTGLIRAGEFHSIHYP